MEQPLAINELSTTSFPPLHKTRLFKIIRDDQCPIVYSDQYDIKFGGMEKLHPFDSQKWGKVFRFLRESGLVTREGTLEPEEATEMDLLVVHTQTYLKSLKRSINVARVTEMAPLVLLPNCLVQRLLLRPLRYQVGGTILAAHCALNRGWAINIGGGFHHCSGDAGGGFCAYADITLCIRFLQRENLLKRALIIDLDAHQGNGHERDFYGDPNVFIMDVYNRDIYPNDTVAKRTIGEKVELKSFTSDEEYLGVVKNLFPKVLDRFAPEFVVYNAGTDILVGDPLGRLSVTARGIISRDETVFTECRKRNIPIVMVTSGGYQNTNARVIADSIANLASNGLIDTDLK